MADTTAWVDAVRASHDRFVSLVQPLSDAAVEGPSYAAGWSIAQTASHLGSQAEIFGLSLEAGLNGTPPPGPDVFPSIWDRWNALASTQQVQESVQANEALVTSIERTSPDDRDRFSLSLFGSNQDFAGLLWMRLGELALHTWDIAVALDDSATVIPQAVELLVDRLPAMVARAGKVAAGSEPVAVATVDPARTFVLRLDPEVSLEPSDEAGANALRMPAEAFIRLVYGRLDPDHTPAGVTDERLESLRTAFPGF